MKLMVIPVSTSTIMERPSLAGLQRVQCTNRDKKRNNRVGYFSLLLNFNSKRY